METPIKESISNYEQMLIIEKYEKVINYLYPIIQNLANKHAVAKDIFLRLLFQQIELFQQAAKLSQVSKLYIVDGNLGSLRFWLRFFVNEKIKGLTNHQKATIEQLLAEVESLLGKWIKKINSLKG